MQRLGRVEAEDTKVFWEKAWLKPQFRHQLVKAFTKLKTAMGQAWTMDEEELKENSLDRETMVGLAGSAAKFLAKLEDIDQKMAKVKKFKNHSCVYRFCNGKKLLVEGQSYDVDSGISSTVTWIMPQGWPLYKPVMIKRYRRILSKQGYQQEKHCQIKSKTTGFKHIVYDVTLNNTKFVLEAEFISASRLKIWRRKERK